MTANLRTVSSHVWKPRHYSGDTDSTEASRIEGVHDLVSMRPVPGLDREVEADALERDARKIAAVLDVDDVGAQTADDLGHRREHAGPIGELDREAHEPARPGERPQQHR